MQVQLICQPICIRGRYLPTLDEVAQSAELFLTARKRQLSDSVKPFTSNSQSKTTVAKKQEVLTCCICKRKGHRTIECISNYVTKQNLGRGCFYCGEMTHVRRDCPRLILEGSKVSAPKRAGLAAARVVETQLSTTNSRMIVYIQWDSLAGINLIQGPKD